MPCWGCGSGGGMQLHQAAERGQADVVQRLLAGGRAADTRDGEGSSPLHVAAAHGQVAIVQLLLAHQAGLHADLNNVGETPLLSAAWHGRAACVRALLQAGASTAAADREGLTALHKVVAGWQRGRAEEFVATARALLAAKASPVAASQAGATPYYLATDRGLDQLQQLFREAMFGGGNASPGGESLPTGGWAVQRALQALCPTLQALSFSAWQLHVHWHTLQAHRSCFALLPSLDCTPLMWFRRCCRPHPSFARTSCQRADTGPHTTAQQQQRRQQSSRTPACC